MGEKCTGQVQSNLSENGVVIARAKQDETLTGSRSTKLLIFLQKQISTVCACARGELAK